MDGSVCYQEGGQMVLDDRDIYLIRRRKARIKLVDIAEYIRCDLSLISKFERHKADMTPKKEARYKEYIDSKLAVANLEK